MKQIIRQIGLLIVTLLAVFPMAAYDFETDGICYNITSMANLEVEVAPSNSSAQYSGNIVIPNTVNYSNKTFTVTGIGARAFYGTSITQITLPETITAIRKSAFSSCKITDITLPSHLKEIESGAFYASGLKSVTIPDNVTKIPENCFEESDLQSVILGKNISVIDRYAFCECTKLLEVYYTSPNKPWEKDYSVFYNTNPFMEKYVPSTARYGFGKEYITFSQDEYDYSGQKHLIEWNNNLKAYKCEIAENDRFTEKNAGEYSGTVTVVYSDGIDLTVEVPYEYTIKQAPMSLFIENIEREYGEQNPVIPFKVYGFVNGESLESLGITPTFHCDANRYSNVGTYRITASLNAPNYNITYEYGNLEIKQAPITVRVVDSKKTYGSKNPDFSFAYSGLKNEESTIQWIDGPYTTTDATQYSDTGDYTVSARNGQTTNYKVINYIPGILTITKRDLTATANDFSRLYHEENPEFTISYSGFVNNDTPSVIDQEPNIECTAYINSDSGTYPITLSGGQDNNYNIICKDGTLTVNPLKVGFKEDFHSVTFNDFSISSSDEHFNYIPEIIGPYDPEDFWLELWFLDKNNKYPGQHIANISSGEYAGNYVNTNIDRNMWAGKYIFNLTSKGTNPNVVADPSRCYVTVNRTFTDLQLTDNSTLEISVGETADIGFAYDADMWCSFNTEYNNEIISLTSTDANTNNPHWYVTGLSEGSTVVYFSIHCNENELGFYDFADSNTVYRQVIVTDHGSVDEITDEYDNISVKALNGRIIILNKPHDVDVRVYNIQGMLVAQTHDSEVPDMPKGLYIVSIGNKSFKLSL